MATLEALISLDMMNAGEQVDVPDEMLEQAPLKGLLEAGYLKVVGDGAGPGQPAAPVETTPPRRARKSEE